MNICDAGSVLARATLECVQCRFGFHAGRPTGMINLGNNAGGNEGDHFWDALWLLWDDSNFDGLVGLNEISLPLRVSQTKESAESPDDLTSASTIADLRGLDPKSTPAILHWINGIETFENEIRRYWWSCDENAIPWNNCVAKNSAIVSSHPHTIDSVKQSYGNVPDLLLALLPEKPDLTVATDGTWHRLYFVYLKDMLSRDDLFYSVLWLENFESLRQPSDRVSQPVICSFAELAAGFVAPPQTVKTLSLTARFKSLWLVRDFNANGQIERKFFTGLSEVGAMPLLFPRVPESQLFAVIQSGIPFFCAECTIEQPNPERAAICRMCQHQLDSFNLFFAATAEAIKTAMRTHFAVTISASSSLQLWIDSRADRDWNSGAAPQELALEIVANDNARCSVASTSCKALSNFSATVRVFDPLRRANTQLNPFPPVNYLYKFGKTFSVPLQIVNSNFAYVDSYFRFRNQPPNDAIAVLQIELVSAAGFFQQNCESPNILNPTHPVGTTLVLQIQTCSEWKTFLLTYTM